MSPEPNMMSAFLDYAMALVVLTTLLCGLFLVLGALELLLTGLNYIIGRWRIKRWLNTPF